MKYRLRVGIVIPDQEVILRVPILTQPDVLYLIFPPVRVESICLLFSILQLKGQLYKDRSIPLPPI